MIKEPKKYALLTQDKQIAGTIRGKKGEKVLIIREGEPFIVENERTKERFSVLKENLKMI